MVTSAKIPLKKSLAIFIVLEILKEDIIQQKNFHNLVVSVGSFDGLHRGHRLVLNQLTRLAKEKNTQSLVLSFEPHPRLVLDQETDSIKLLSNIEEKIILFEEIGIDYLLIYPFTKEFAATKAEDFIINIESTEKPPLIADAVAKFSENIETLIPQMAMMNKKYPELKNFDVSPPVELASESALLRKIEPRLKDVFYKIRGYMEDEGVKKEMSSLQTVLEQMKRVQ